MATFNKNGADIIMRLDLQEEWSPAFPQLAIERGYNDLSCTNVMIALPRTLFSQVRIDLSTAGFVPTGSTDDFMIVKRNLRGSGDGIVRSCLENANSYKMPKWALEYGIEKGLIEPPKPAPTSEEIEARYRRAVHFGEARIIDDRSPSVVKHEIAPEASEKFDYEAGKNAGPRPNEDMQERLADIRRQQEAIADRIKQGGAA
jgi:hypothetical protein